MRNIKITIQYDGTRYKGWQRQPDLDSTIQGKLEILLSKITGEKIEIIGSGRTDAGVHAENQVANFKTACDLSLDYIMEKCYEYLPLDIVIKDIEEVEESFHARYSAVGKKYVYKICNRKYHDVFNRKYSCHIGEKLDIDSMKKACSLLIGEKDFKSFTTLKSKKKSTVRHIYSIDIFENNGDIDIVYKGNGFLRNMVRIITGTLIEVGLHKREVKEIEDILNKKERSAAGYLAPPEGLFLMKVYY